MIYIYILVTGLIIRKVCLFDNKEVSLRDLIRGGASDEELMQLVKSALGGKKEKHSGMEDIDVKYNRPMITIGLSMQYNCTYTILTRDFRG